MESKLFMHFGIKILGSERNGTSSWLGRMFNKIRSAEINANL